MSDRGPAIWDLVMEDIRKRDALGERRYGERLRPHNGRDALMDAYEEALDLVAYLRQVIEERRDERNEQDRQEREDAKSAKAWRLARDAGKI